MIKQNAKRIRLLDKVQDIINSGTMPLENPPSVSKSIRWKCKCGCETTSSITLKWKQLQTRGETVCTNCDDYTSRAQQREATLSEDVVRNRLKLGDFEINGSYLGSTIVKHDIKCLICGDVSNTTIRAKFQAMESGNRGCMTCLKTANEQAHLPGRMQVLSKLNKLGIEVLTEDYNGEYVYRGGQKIKVHNIHTDEIFEVTPTNLLSRGVISPEFGKRKRIEKLIEHNKRLYAEWNLQRPEQVQYTSEVRLATESTYKLNESVINRFGYERVRAGSSGQEGMQLDHIIPITWGWENKIPVELLTSVDNLRMITWQDNLEKGTSMPPFVPPLFHGYFNKEQRMDLATNWIIENVPNVSIDTVCPHSSDECFVGVHHDSNVVIFLILNDVVQISKYRIAEQFRLDSINHGLTPVIIFEDELTNEFLLRQKLLHITKQSNSMRVYARSTKVVSLDKASTDKFLDRYHLQGTVQHQHSFGLMYNDDIVAVMTFTKPRAALGRNTQIEDEWELSRYATNYNYHVIGGAGKLLKRFKSTVSWTKIFSYADKRWSSGNMYETLGFDQVADNPPQYFYNVGDGRRQHRWMFRKDILKTKFAHVYDENLTEEQILENAGLYRIWDCGTLTYELCNL